MSLSNEVTSVTRAVVLVRVVNRIGGFGMSFLGLRMARDLGLSLTAVGLDVYKRQGAGGAARASRSRTAYRRCSHSSSRMVRRQESTVFTCSGAWGLRRGAARVSAVTAARKAATVSYTHLDVYKRQE